MKSEIIKKSMSEQSAAVNDIALSSQETNSIVQDNLINAENIRENTQKLKAMSQSLEMEFAETFTSSQNKGDDNSN